MRKSQNDVRVNFMLEKDKHNDLSILARMSGKSITAILTDYINKIINDNSDLIIQRKEIESQLNNSLKF